MASHLLWAPTPDPFLTLSFPMPPHVTKRSCRRNRPAWGKSCAPVSPSCLPCQLKPACGVQSPNILVDASYRFKIADFGLSQTRQHTLASRGAAGGTPEW